MGRHKDILKLARMEIVVLLLFVPMKLLRPFIMEHTDIEWVHIFFLSFPNLAEGIIGVLTSTMLVLVIRNRYHVEFLTDHVIYMIAVLFSAVYVLLQEFKVHNLGGNNVYDFNDVVFSIIGLIIGFSMIWTLGPTIKEDALQ